MWGAARVGWVYSALMKASPVGGRDATEPPLVVHDATLDRFPRNGGASPHMYEGSGADSASWSGADSASWMIFEGVGSVSLARVVGLGDRGWA